MKILEDNARHGNLFQQALDNFEKEDLAKTYLDIYTYITG